MDAIQYYVIYKFANRNNREEYYGKVREFAKQYLKKE